MKPHATHTDASENWACPIAKTFAVPITTCRGAACPLWRWTTGPAFVAAVKRVAEEIGDKSAAKADAAAAVSADPIKHGLHGFCGLGGNL